MKPVILPLFFYLRNDVVLIARELLGKFLFTRTNGIVRSGMITETEAYAGAIDRASHAYGGRKTSRTKVMFMQGGVAYVYLCYGIHSLFNVVTNVEGTPDAVLIRAVEINGVPANHTKGPGRVSKYFNIHYSQSGLTLSGPEIWIEDHGVYPGKSEILVSKRIGVDYAGPDAELPYRFEFISNKGNR